MMTPNIMVQLIHIHGGLKGEIQEFFQSPILIGRLSSCTVKFPPDEPGVSREHARIEREGNQFKLIDLSKFGTFVNGKQVKETFLRSGDVLEFGPGGPKVSVTMEIVAHQPAPAEPVFAPPVAPPLASQAAVAPQPPRVYPAAVEPPRQYAPEPPQYAAPATPAPPAAFAQHSAPPVTAVPKAMAPLVIQFGPTIRTYRELPVIIGAHHMAGFVIKHPGILDQHAEIFFYQDAYWVRELTGQGLMRVNLRRIDAAVQLAPNDEILCSPQGPTFRFLGEGRLAEVEPVEEPPQPGNTEEKRIDDTSRKIEGGNFLSKLVKGFKS